MYTIVTMIREQIRRDLAVAISNFQFPISNEEIGVSRTTDAKFGDFSTNVALKIRHGIKQSPIETAKILTDSLKDLPYVEKLEVAGPGFINFFIKPEVWQEQVEDVPKAGARYGANQSGKGKKARVEFVSANPTGPLHFGNARGGPIGDVLASVLEFCGYKVVREYYHNDVGGQVVKLGDSVLKVAAGGKLEDQEYKGEYIRDLAYKLNSLIVSKINPNTPITNVNVALNEFIGKEAVDVLFKEIKEDCKAMGITFDEFYPESEFIKKGQTKAAFEKIKKFLKEKDGATWFAPSDEFLKDRETVVRKSDGSYTYFANDIAYHDLKFKDKPDLVIDIFGANHHGHVPRLQAVIKAFGYDVSKFHVILYQWVRFRKGKEILKMSKRSGTFVTAREVLEEVGRDALRFFILMHDPNSHIDFDLELAKQKSKENPVYYVQYAHARICSILANSKLKTQNSKLNPNYELLTTKYELDLIKQISRLPELVCDIAESFAVHRLTTYATDLADSFHRFYENCRIIGEKEDLTQARVALIQATKITLVNTLKLLGISAPEKM